ncbi:MAG TPA: DUF1045 domain-containing protein [Stellaceae bacterium]|nr:DUF1045 domain-containing protein [Stellaceae bacterium]
MTGGNEGRYAVYFAPDPASALAQFGAAWLGYDVATGATVPQPAVEGIAPERLGAITAEPRRYGFHATLKPPFFVAEGRDASSLSTAVAALAAGVAAFTAPRLQLKRISGFWALTPSAPCSNLDRLAEICVRELDAFRAAPSTEELARRRRAQLSPRQEELLVIWGYPYVLEQFRFHMTLTGRLDGTESDTVGEALAPLVTPYCTTPLTIDAVSLFHQERAGAPFHLLRRYPLAG